MKNLFGMELSTGSVCSCIDRLSLQLEPVPEAVRQELVASGNLNIDETGWKCQGKRRYLEFSGAGRTQPRRMPDECRGNPRFAPPTCRRIAFPSHFAEKETVRMKKHFGTLLAVVVLLAWSAVSLAAGPILVVGHKNPDTDAVVSAIAMADLKTQQGIPAIAIAQGAPNPETRFVLEAFKLDAPSIQTGVAGRRVILVDHSDYLQAPDDITGAEVVGLVDHHKLGGLTTDVPIEVRVSPVGSTSTIIAQMYASAGISIPSAVAGGMLGAIISDTLLFKSPTTTQEDRDAAAKLAGIAGVEDVQAFGLKQLQAKSSIAGMSAKDLLKQDLKTFDMHGRKVGVAQLELMDLAGVSPMKDEFFSAMKTLKDEGYHSVLLMLTDITKEGTDLLVVSDDAGVIEAAFGLKEPGNAVWLPGVVSRKKQVVPGLLKAFERANPNP